MTLTTNPSTIDFNLFLFRLFLSRFSAMDEVVSDILDLSTKFNLFRLIFRIALLIISSISIYWLSSSASSFSYPKMGLLTGKMFVTLANLSK